MYRWRAGWLSWYADGLLTIWLFNHSFILSEDSACLSIFFLSIVIYKSPQYCLCLLPLAGNWWFMQLLRSQKMACLMRRWQRCKLTLHKHTANLPSCTTYLLLHLLCARVSHRVKKSSLNISQTRSLLSSLLGFSHWRIGKEKTTSIHGAFVSSRYNLNLQPQSIWQSFYKEVAQHSICSQRRELNIAGLKFVSSTAVIHRSQLTVHMCQTNDSDPSFLWFNKKALAPPHWPNLRVYAWLTGAIS